LIPFNSVVVLNWINSEKSVNELLVMGDDDELECFQTLHATCQAANKKVII